MGPLHLLALRPFVAQLALALTATACAGGPSEDDIRRSEAEYELAAGLVGEQNYAGAFEHLAESIRLDPDNAEAHFLLGSLHLFRNDFATAEQELLAAIDANTRLGRSGLPSLTPDAQNSLGVLYVNAGRLDEAVTTLRASAADLMNTTPHLALGNLGWAYLELGRATEALEVLTQAVRREPQFCVGWYRLAQAYEALASDASDPAAVHRNAEDALSQAVGVEAEVCEDFQDAWLLRGQVRAHLGRSEDAATDFERCVEIDATTDAGRTCASALDRASTGTEH